MTTRRSPLYLILFSAVLAAILIIHFVKAYNAGPDDEVLAIALQSDGKSIIGGKFSPGRIERRNTDGSTDTAFSSSWSVGGFNAPVLALAVQSDNKVIAGGEFTSFDTSLAGGLIRLNANGSLDTAFANALGTGFNDWVMAVAVQSDGKILAGGRFSAVNGHAAGGIVRLNSDGTVDSTFASSPGFDGVVQTMSLLDQGKIAVGGAFQKYGNLTSPYFVYLTSTGAADASQ